MMSWKQYVARLALATVAISGGVFIAVRAANAEQGGRSRDALTVTGTLTGVTGTPTLAFTLRKGSVTCPVTARSVVLNGSAFSAEVPLDACPAFFDGSDVTVDVSVNGTPVVTGSAVNPVPYARYADQVGTPECPVGFDKDPSGSTTSITVCARTIAGGRDEVVRVGTGATAFWIDRYEASVFTRAGVRSDDYAGLSVNGQWATGARASLLALSRPNVLPAVRVNWFQASALCRASGKRLVGREEWFAAADGMTARELQSNNCSYSTSAVRAAGAGTNCESSWGVQDLIGNAAEWTDEWYASTGQTETNSGVAWPAEFGMDTNSGIFGAAAAADRYVAGLPSAAARGLGVGATSGVYRLDITASPANANSLNGFRCVIPR